MKEAVFGTILRMSLIGCYSTAVVLLARFVLLRLLKAPRKFAYYLWMAVFLNLCLPFSISSPVSLIPKNVEMLSVRTEQAASEEKVGMGSVSGAGGASAQSGRDAAVWNAASFLWLGGAVLLLGLQALLALRFRRRLTRLRCVREGKRERIRELKGLPAPFLWGIFR